MKILEDVNMSKVDVVEILKKSDALLEGHFLSKEMQDAIMARNAHESF